MPSKIRYERKQLLKWLSLQTSCTRTDEDLQEAYGKGVKPCNTCTAPRNVCGGTAATLNGELNASMSRVRMRF